MNYIKTFCSYCNKSFLKEPRRFNESNKYGWNKYCSLRCQYLNKNKHLRLECANPLCKKNFKRLIYKKSKKHFCSQSCSAKVSNRERAEKRPKKYCVNPSCKKQIQRWKKYCSNTCSSAVRKFPDDEYRHKIIERIKVFYHQKGRIPFKREMWGIYHASRRLFGTWNKAIKAAGLNPNPVKFARKHIAKDGHKCDSLAEKIIDDWLFKRKIPHEIHIPYNKYRMSADFQVKDFFIEFIGLQGELKVYDDALRRKEKMWEENNINVIKIYPEDLFPENRLDNILNKFFIS